MAIMQRESYYKLEECCMVQEMTDDGINICATMKEDKDFGMSVSHSVYTVTKGTELRLVKYFTDSRIFSFEVVTDSNYEGREIRYFKGDTINLKENEFEWFESDNNPITYFEPHLTKKKVWKYL